MRKKGRLLQYTHQVGPDQCAKSGAYKDDEPVLVADLIGCLMPQINIIAVTRKISQRFANKMRGNAGFADGYGDRKVQDAFLGEVRTFRQENALKFIQAFL